MENIVGADASDAVRENGSRQPGRKRIRRARRDGRDARLRRRGGRRTGTTFSSRRLQTTDRLLSAVTGVGPLYAERFRDP
jgi:hypothetical protein